MKIFQLITELRPAGAERIVVDLSKELQKKGHELFVISLKPLPTISNLVDELDDAKISVHSLKMNKFAFWRIIEFRRLVRQIQPEIVHAHLIHANVISRLVTSRKRYKLINTVHIAEKRPGKYWHFWLDRVTYRLCDHETCVSSAVRDFHAKKIGVPKQRMSVIYNGIEASKPLTSEERKRLRMEWGVDGCSSVIGSVGRLDYQKGYDLFFKNLEKIGDRIPPEEKWGIVIIGDGSMKTELEQLSRKIDPRIQVCLPGFRPDAAQCIGAFDIFVMPSRYEGFGLTLVEAMSQGIPILASNVDSLPELMEHYPNGEMVDFFLAGQEIVHEKLERLLKRGFSKPVIRFSTKQMVESYEKLYKALS